MNQATTIRAILLALLALASQTATAWQTGGFQPASVMNANMQGHFGFGFGGTRNTNHFPAPYPRPATSYILHGVNFRYDSAELTPESKQVLDSVARLLRSQASGPMEISGHASAEGDAEYNLELSSRRATEVRDYLVSRGVDSDRLLARGYGESRPLAYNETENGRQLNRRVELARMMTR